MGFRDDGDAQRARVEALEQELAQSRLHHDRELAAERERHEAELATERARREALEKKLRGRPREEGSRSRSGLIIGGLVGVGLIAGVAFFGLRSSPRAPSTVAASGPARAVQRPDARAKPTDLAPTGLARALVSLERQGVERSMALSVLAIGAFRRREASADWTADRLLAQAREQVRLGSSPVDQAAAHLFLACAEGAAGRAAQAATSIDEGKALLGVATSYADESKLFTSTAETCVDVSERGVSGELLKRATAAALKVPNVYSREPLLVEIARVQGQRGDVAALLELAALARQITTAYAARAGLHAVIAEQLHRAGQRVEATTRFAAIKVSDQLRPGDLAPVARAAAVIGVPDARAHVDRATESLRRAGYVGFQPRFELAVALALLKDDAAARQVLGAPDHWGRVLVAAGRLDDALALNEHAYTGYALALALARSGRAAQALVVTQRLQTSLRKIIALTMASSPAPPASAPAEAH